MGNAVFHGAVKNIRQGIFHYLRPVDALVSEY